MDLLAYIQDLDFQFPQFTAPTTAVEDWSNYFDFLADDGADYFGTDSTSTVDMSNTLSTPPEGMGIVVNKGRKRKAMKVEEEMGTVGTSGVHKRERLSQSSRRLWVKDRSNSWWDTVNSPEFTEVEFRKAFRMGRSTFDRICDELSAAVAKEDTTLRNAIPVSQRVAVCIWRLATGEPLRVVSTKFGLGISTCHKLILEVCSAIKTVLIPKYLRWPEDSGSVQSIKSRFETRTGIPNVIGSMYTTHVPVVAPKTSVGDYFNRRQTERNQKTSYSVTIQGVVDPDGIFTDVCIGLPGGMTDQQVLENSVLYHRFNQTENSTLNKQQWIVGGSGYPLMDWMMVPYSHQNITWTQHAFNEKASEVRRSAVEAFGRLKGRWKYLQRRTEVKLQDLPVVLGACCVLHNVCEMMKEEMEPDLRFEVVDDEFFAENPVQSLAAAHVRDVVAHDLLHNSRVGPSV